MLFVIGDTKFSNLSFHLEVISQHSYDQQTPKTIWSVRSKIRHRVYLLFSEAHSALPRFPHLTFPVQSAWCCQYNGSMWCSKGCPNGPELSRLYYFRWKSVVNIGLMQDCKEILCEVNVSCSVYSFRRETPKNVFAKSVALCYRPVAWLICSRNDSTSHMPVVIYTSNWLTLKSH